MPRTCIICGNPANSREHIFPAALGGLRVNRGIYCETHNNAFSGLAGVLSQQLGMWNALLGVRDRSRQPRVHRTATPEGEEVVVAAGSVQRADPSLRDADAGIHLQLGLGGPEGLPGIGYVALTFFAHYFADAAREVGLDPIKGFIQGHGENEFVWWESATTTRELPANPFVFGHTIILTTSQATGQARALVCLFQTLTFGVDLGSVSGVSDRTVTVFIDPHAERQPLDTQDVDRPTVEMVIEPPNPRHAHLERMVRHGHGQELLQDLMARIEQWNFANEMADALVGLNAARTLPMRERVYAIQGIVEAEVARLHRLMWHFVEDLRQRVEAQPELAPIVDALAAQLALTDPDESTRDLANMSLARVVAAFIEDLVRKIGEGPIDMEYLWMLFSGGPGMHLAGQTMLDPVMRAIGAPRDWLQETDR